MGHSGGRWRGAMHVFLSVLFLLPAVTMAATASNNASNIIREPTTIVPTEEQTTISLELIDKGSGKSEEVEEDGDGKAVSFPCKCVDGTCSCCTGNLLENFSINMRQRLCSNLSYDADDFTIGVKLAFNNRVLYQNRISGKNPPPVCLPIPRLTSIRVCVRFNNVYLIGRNIHACVGVEAQFNKESIFEYKFDCIRLGTGGVAVVSPEDGGGLPVPIPDIDAVDDIEEYDENIAETDKPPKKKKGNVTSIDF